MARSPSVILTCIHCSTVFSVPAGRKDSAKFCSRHCSDVHPRVRHSVLCRECGTEFFKKESEARKTVWGNFCSTKCSDIVRSRMNLGDKNPNFKGRLFDQDGYQLFTPQASLRLGLGRMKVHTAVALTAIGLIKAPPKLHVHHRDCNIQNNEPSNLVFMTPSDHKWLHKQYGSATLAAISGGRISIDEVALWSDDPRRAHILLISDVTSQGVLMNYFKSKFGHANLAKIISLKPVEQVEFEEVDDLGITERGTGGFGSTGK